MTCCTTSSCLPGRARLVTVGFGAPGTTYPPYRRFTRVTGKDDTASSRAVWGPGKFRMHNLRELSMQSSLVSKSQSC